MFPAVYERLGVAPFSCTPAEVDNMELWQVVSLLGWWRSDEDAVPAAPGAGSATGRAPKAVNERTLIKARLAAAARGEPEPTWIFGAPRSTGVGVGR